MFGNGLIHKQIRDISSWSSFHGSLSPKDNILHFYCPLNDFTLAEIKYCTIYAGRLAMKTL